MNSLCFVAFILFANLGILHATWGYNLQGSLEREALITLRDSKLFSEHASIPNGTEYHQVPQTNFFSSSQPNNQIFKVEIELFPGAVEELNGTLKRGRKTLRSSENRVQLGKRENCVTPLTEGLKEALQYVNEKCEAECTSYVAQKCLPQAKDPFGPPYFEKHDGTFAYWHSNKDERIDTETVAIFGKRTRVGGYGALLGRIFRSIPKQYKFIKANSPDVAQAKTAIEKFVMYWIDATYARYRDSQSYTKSNERHITQFIMNFNDLIQLFATFKNEINDPISLHPKTYAMLIVISDYISSIGPERNDPTDPIKIFNEWRAKREVSVRNNVISPSAEPSPTN